MAFYRARKKVWTVILWNSGQHQFPDHFKSKWLNDTSALCLEVQQQCFFIAFPLYNSCSYLTDCTQLPVEVLPLTVCLSTLFMYLWKRLSTLSWQALHRQWVTPNTSFLLYSKTQFSAHIFSCFTACFLWCQSWKLPANPEQCLSLCIPLFHIAVALPKWHHKKCHRDAILQIECDPKKPQWMAS